MNISVILCTYNRCQSLATALASVAVSTLPDSVEWEVLVIDNNSADQTRATVEEFVHKYPGRFRYIFESHPGKSYALNTGIREARGSIVAFMDDDVTVEPDWLQKLTENLRNGTWAGTGGRILPRWDWPPPPWLPSKERHGLAPLAMFDLGTDAGELMEPAFGTNMAFQKRLFEKYGGFRTDLGPCPGSEIRSEDTEFGRRVLAAGERLWYEPSAVVFHPVSKQRLRKKYFLDWRFDKARADIREFGIPKEGKLCVQGIPLYLFRRLAVWTLRWLFTMDSAQRFSCKINAWGAVGMIKECPRVSRRNKLHQQLSSTPEVFPAASKASVHKPVDFGH
jgi:glucosyl-dolichyl phosphate glucuronosyltransferase